LQNATKLANHENRLKKCPIKCIINYLDLSQEEYDELSSPPSLVELNASEAQAKVPFEHPVDHQDPNTLSVPYELFIKLPPHVKMFICEAQKAEHGYEQCKVNYHEVDNITTDDLALDIDNLELSGYQDEANSDECNASNLGDGDDQQILAHVIWYKVLPHSGF